MSIAQRRFRMGVLVVILLSWVTLVVMMWRAFHTVPSAEALADAQPMRPPLPTDFYLNVLTSFGETLFLAIALWPWWVRRYIIRATVALILLVVWFFATVPLDLNTMEWLHRRWLAFLVLLLLLIPLGYPFLQRRSRSETQS